MTSKYISKKSKIYIFSLNEMDLFWIFLRNDPNLHLLSFLQTFEESITQLMTFGRVVGEKKLPIRLYQVRFFHWFSTPSKYMVVYCHLI